jgi:outer membrane protein assembly factor BamB
LTVSGIDVTIKQNRKFGKEKPSMPIRAVLVLAVAITLSGDRFAPAADIWPQFRGPTGLGYTSERDLPLTWGGASNKNVLWAAPLVGEGHASPIVWKDRVFVCTVRWPATVKDRTKVIPEHHVLCYATSDGRKLWDTQVPPGPWLRTDFRSGPGGGYAAPTPATDGRLVFCVFGSSVIAALDFGGTIVWRKEFRPYNFDVTIGTSPVLYGDTLLMLCAMTRSQDSRLIAFNKKDGSIAWQTPLPQAAFAHSTPVLIDAGGRKQLIVAASGMSESPEGIESLNPETGRRLWWCKGAGEAASPAFGAGILYCDSGRGGAGMAIDPTGAGEVTRTHIKWRKERLSEGIGSPIIVDGLVYRLLAPNLLKGWRAADGTQVYSERLEGLTTTWASPIADGAGRIYYASAGKSYVLQAGPKFHILAVNDLGDPNHASAAVADGRIYLAGTRKLYCIGKK